MSIILMVNKELILKMSKLSTHRDTPVFKSTRPFAKIVFAEMSQITVLSYTYSIVARDLPCRRKTNSCNEYDGPTYNF